MTMQSEQSTSLATRFVAGFIVLILLDAAQLLLLYPGRTDELWAWEIRPDISSMVLASAYVGGGLFFVRVMFGASWPRVAAGLPPVILFVWMAAIATALHLDRFFEDRLQFIFWAALYTLTPIGIPILYAYERGRSLARSEARIGLVTRRALGIAGAAIVLLMLVMLAAPQPFIDAWPWTLTPLTARITAAVLGLYGGVWLSVALDGTRTGARIPLESHALGLLFLLVALVAGSGDVDWGNALAPLLAAVAAAMMLISLSLARRGA
jgi:hypothetical protein